MIHFEIERKEKSILTHAFALVNSFPIKRKQNILLSGKRMSSFCFGALQLVRNLGTYVPNVLLKYMADNPEPPTKPNIQLFPASILFLDISGFTSLNERLAQLGPAGPELVSKHINSYFASLIKAVSEHGGDVLKFAGDALICMWSGNNNNNLNNDDNSNQTKELTLRAIQCGFDIQTRLAKYDSNEGFSLTLHIGIGSGDLLSLWVGSEGSWEYLVSGEPLAQLRTAVDNSNSGEVVISKECWKLVNDVCEGEPRENDYYISKILKPLPIERLKSIKNWPRADAEASLRCFIPLAVQASIESQQTQGWGNELRIATILFVKLNTDIPNNTKEIYLSSINSVLCCMQKTVFKYEGMIRQFLADDKGTVLIAAFGLPPYCHLEDPLRGIKAALEIHNDLKNLNMDSSIGVTTGQVYCGSVGCPVRQEYAMVGDVVNLSARLMVAAYKQNVHILCDQSTYESSASTVSFNILEPIMVKGKKNPINIYQPIADKREGEKRYKYNRLDIVGHLNIRKTIKSFILKLTEEEKSSISKGGIVIEGISGIGKSVLCQYTISLCKRRKLLVCYGSGDRFQKSISFYPWRSILLDLAGITNVYSKNSSLNRLNNQLLKYILNLENEYNGKTMKDSLPLLNDIFGSTGKTFIDENDFTLSLHKEERNYYIARLLNYIVSNEALKNPFVLIMEDIQFIDSESIKLLSTLANTCSSILIFTTIDEKASSIPIYQDLLSAPNMLNIEIPALSEQEVNELLQKILNVDSIPNSVTTVFKAAQGNPRLIREISYDLIDSRGISIENRQCNVIGNLSEIGLNSVEGVINAKLDRLPKGQQIVLKVASVIGYSFELYSLLAIYPFENKKFIKEELEALKISGLIRNNGENSYQFENQQYLKVTYSRLTFAQRIQLHKKLVELYESQSISLSMYPKLAYHVTVIIENTKDPDIELLKKGGDYLRQAGEYAAIAHGRSVARIWREYGIKVTKLLPDTEPYKEELKENFERCLNSLVIHDKIDASLRELSGVGGPSQHLIEENR